MDSSLVEHQLQNVLSHHGMQLVTKREYEIHWKSSGKALGKHDHFEDQQMAAYSACCLHIYIPEFECITLMTMRDVE